MMENDGERLSEVSREDAVPGGLQMLPAVSWMACS